MRLHDGQSDAVVRDYDASVWYLISDRAPYMDVEVVGPALLAAEAKPPGILTMLDKTEKKPGLPYWQRWDLGAYISGQRRTGSCELKLKVPKAHSLRCYVVPSKLLALADVWSMIEAVEAEVGRPIAWDLDAGHRARSWVSETRRQDITMTDLLLSSVTDELEAARALRRDPPTEVDPTGVLQPIPELGLIPMWAMRRGGELARAAEYIERDLAEYERRLREYMPENRRLPMEKLLADARGRLDRLRPVLRSVQRHIIREELGRPLAFSPATQRDHRLRKLLRAFAPSPSEVISDVASGWSRFPPVTLNKLFEGWAAVWLVGRLRELGFSGGPELALGTDLLEGARWTLRRGDIRVILDYEAHPAQIDFARVPPVEDRIESAVEWAIARQLVDFDRPLFGSEKECSPDYILRIDGPAGRVMAIGDACLADPKYHTGEKVDSVVNYRSSIYWSADGRAIGCHPLGAFAVYPGPPELWDDVGAAKRASDVWMFCPEPRKPNEQAAENFARFLDRLLGEVTRQ